MIIPRSLSSPTVLSCLSLSSYDLISRFDLLFEIILCTHLSSSKCKRLFFVHLLFLVLFRPPQFKFSFEKLFNCHNVVEFYMVNKPIIANRFVRYNLHHNITRFAIIKRKTSKKNKNLKF